MQQHGTAAPFCYVPLSPPTTYALTHGELGETRPTVTTDSIESP